MRGAGPALLLAGGALASSLVLFALIWRVSAVAQEWRRELRRTRAELHRLENDLRAAAAKADMLSEAAAQGFVICDREGVILDANKYIRDYFELPDPIGRTVLAMTLSYDVNTFILEASSAQELRGTAQFALSYPDARAVSISVWRATRNSERIAVSFQDITELRRLERVRSDFVANVSHELRTPMATMRAMAETLLEDDASSEETRKRYLHKIVEEVDRLTTLSDDLLTLAASESRSAEKTEVDLAEIARESVQQMRPYAIEKKIPIEIDAPDKLPIMGERNLLIQVLINLLTNAIHYTVEGKIDVSVRKQNDEAIVEVRDTGIGIESEHLPRIFERFYRVDKARSRATGGTGLGLSIVRHIVETVGGIVEVESEPAVGSVFRVRLPL